MGFNSAFKGLITLAGTQQSLFINHIR